MWVFLNDAFVSIVAHSRQRDMLMVRARFPQDIKRAFPGAKVKRTPDADYLYRAVLPREVVAETLAEQARNIAYPNFKSSVKDQSRHDTYLRVWDVMYAAQEKKRKSKRTPLQYVDTGFDAWLESYAVSLGPDRD